MILWPPLHDTACHVAAQTCWQLIQPPEQMIQLPVKMGARQLIDLPEGHAMWRWCLPTTCPTTCRSNHLRIRHHLSHHAKCPSCFVASLPSRRREAAQSKTPDGNEPKLPRMNRCYSLPYRNVSCRSFFLDTNFPRMEHLAPADIRT